jgi:hypothetical protein
LGEDIKLRPFREEKRPSARAGTQTLGVEDLVESLSAVTARHVQSRKDLFEDPLDEGTRYCKGPRG